LQHLGAGSSPGLRVEFVATSLMAALARGTLLFSVFWAGTDAQAPIHTLESKHGVALVNFTGIKLDLYRALRAADTRKSFENEDFASLPGVMSYIQTEVVAEHSSCNTDYGKKKPDRRRSRCHKIDSIVQARFYVKNPDKLIDKVGSIDHLVDFGWHNAFSNGEAMLEGKQIKKYGDFVGARRHRDGRFPTTVPNYWFSLSGPCPNRIWKKKFKKRGHPSSGLRRGCAKYLHKYLHKSGYIKGGLCPGTLPTGKAGCSYNYVLPSASDLVNLDELAGITREDCGKRKCKDWGDFRKNCTNKAYKRRFNYNRRRDVTVEHSKVCVEYDVHWQCAGNWDAEECHEIPEDKREIGLPYWRGRGLTLPNMQRIEQLAGLFGIQGARTRHNLVADSVRANFSTCLVGDEDHMCHPQLNEGGMYCSRQWAGVCQPCYVPGTAEVYSRAQEDPACPWTFFEDNKDYSNFSDNFTMDYMTVSVRGDCPSKEHAGLGAAPAGKDKGPMFVVESDPSHMYETNITRLWLKFNLTSLAYALVVKAKLLLHQNIHANRSNTQLFIGRATTPGMPTSCPRISWDPAGFDTRTALRFGEDGPGPGVRSVSLLHEVDIREWVQQWVTGKVPDLGVWIWLGHNNSAAYFDSAVLEVTWINHPFKCATDQPKDLCCLYTVTCNSTIPTDPALTPLDENGFAIISRKKSTTAMLTFLKRLIEGPLKTIVTDPKGLADYAYWAWHDHPLGRSLIDVEVDLAPYVRDRPGASVEAVRREELQPQGYHSMSAASVVLKLLEK